MSANKTPTAVTCSASISVRYLPVEMRSLHLLLASRIIVSVLDHTPCTSGNETNLAGRQHTSHTQRVMLITIIKHEIGDLKNKSSYLHK